MAVIGPVGPAAAGGQTAGRAQTLDRSAAPRHPNRPPARSWAAATRFPRPRFRPTRRIVVHTVGSFLAAWRGIRPGDEIDVRGVSFPGEILLTNKRLSRWAEVHFDSRTRFLGDPAPDNVPAVYLTNDSYIRFYGGDISDGASHGTAGTGITLHDSSHVSWWNFVVHHVGAGAIYLAGVHRQSSYLDFKGEVYDWGRNLAFDPHPEKGTGLHGINVADSYLGVTHSRLAIYAHDARSGSAMSIGGARPTDRASYNTIYLRCRNLTMRATIQIAGNCIQFWGENDVGNVVAYLQAGNITGRPYDANGLFEGQSLSTDRVEYGRAVRTNLNPYLNRTESAIPARMQWDRRGGTVFRDIGRGR